MSADVSQREIERAVWEALVRRRLAAGPAPSCELGRICKANHASRFWGWLRTHQSFAVRQGRELGPTGHDNIVWALGDGDAA